MHMNSRDVMSEITKRKKPGVQSVSNFFPNPAMDQMTFEVITGNSTIVFWGNDSLVTRAYFYSCDKKELTQLLQKVPAGTILDYICKAGQFPREEIENSGFHPIASYCKRQLPLDELDKEPESKRERLLYDMYNPDCGNYASIEDLMPLQDLFAKVFDPRVDHLYPKEELQYMIKKNEVLVYKVNDRIESFYVFKREGKRLYSAFSYNNATADILYNLERRERDNARKLGMKIMYAWFNEENHKALRRTILADTNIRDYIFTKQE